MDGDTPPPYAANGGTWSRPTGKNVMGETWPSLLAVPLVAAVAAGLFMGQQAVTFHAVAYAVAALVVPVLFVTHRVYEARARTSVWYVPRQWANGLALIAVTVALVLAAGHAWIVATELAKR